MNWKKSIDGWNGVNPKSFLDFLIEKDDLGVGWRLTTNPSMADYLYFKTIKKAKLVADLIDEDN